MPKTYLCNYCQNEFTANHGTVNKYCSTECKKLAQNKIRPQKELVVAFFNQGQTCAEIARNVEGGRKAVSSFLKTEVGLHRTRSESLKITRSKFPSQFQKEDNTGPNHPSWKTGRIDIHGYVGIWNREHPRADSKGYVFEHILVWEQVHNKPLPKGWVIHHLNGIKNDNRPCNLAGMPSREHAHVLAKKAMRIRELETENQLLRSALEKSQSIFVLEEN